MAEAGPSSERQSGEYPSGGAGPGTPHPQLQTAMSAPAGSSAPMAAAAVAAASAARAARTPSSKRRAVPDEPGDEAPAKRRRVRPKRGAKGRRQRALRNTPSDVWAAIFKKLLHQGIELPKLRLVCRQFDDAVSARVIQHIRPNRSLRDAQLSNLLQRFPILQSLDLSGCDSLTGGWLRDLEHHTSLKRLVLDRCGRVFAPRESNYWIYISSAENLEMLSVADNPHFSDEDLGLTFELERLASLNVSGCAALNEDSLMMFGQDPGFSRHMTHLDLSRLPKLADACMAGLPGLPNLRELSLAHSSGLTWEGLGHMAPLPHLTSLSVEGCARISLAGAALGLSALASLRRLDASWLGADMKEDDDVDTEAALRRGNDGVGWSSWADCLARSLSRLEELRVGGANATDFDLMALRPLTGLTSLDICDSPEISSDGLSALLQLRSLAAVNLEGCLGVDDDGVALLAQLPALSDLDLGACDAVSDQGLQSLAAVSSLRSLNAVDCSVSDDGITALRSSLQSLAVSHTRTPDGYWEVVLTDDEDFDDLDGEEWELMLVEAGEDSDNASDAEEGAMPAAVAGEDVAGGGGAQAGGGDAAQEDGGPGGDQAPGGGGVGGVAMAVDGQQAGEG